MQQMNDFECRKLERYLFGVLANDSYRLEYKTTLKTYKLYCRLVEEGAYRLYAPHKYFNSITITEVGAYRQLVKRPNWVSGYDEFLCCELFKFLKIATKSDSYYTVNADRALLVLKALLSLLRKEPRYEF